MADCELDYNKKEYAIVGDNVFFSGLNSIPSWLEEYIKNLTYVTMYELYAGYSGGLWDALGLTNILGPDTDIFDISINLLNALRALEVAKNDYKFYVDKKITDDMAYVATLETLNANIGNNDATIKNLQLTYADQFMAVASQISLLTAATATANAETASIRSAIATQTGALAQRIDSLVTNYTDVNSRLTATATAVQQLETFTGLINGEVTAWSQFITDLNAAVTDLDGNPIAGSGNTTGTYVRAAVNANNGNMATYALYSNVNRIYVNGEPYLSGFGAYSGAEIPYQAFGGTHYVPKSTFWVAADEFKVYPSATLSSADVEWVPVDVYNPSDGTMTTQKLVTGINNALPVFGINTITNKITMSADVEINGNLVVNGTITTGKIGLGSVSNAYTSKVDNASNTLPNVINDSFNATLHIVVEVSGNSSTTYVMQIDGAEVDRTAIGAGAGVLMYLTNQFGPGNHTINVYADPPPSDYNSYIMAMVLKR